MSRKRVSDLLLLQTILTHPGISDSEIGKKLSLSRVQVSRRKNEPEFQAHLAREYHDVSLLLKAYRARTIRRMLELVESVDEKIALKACEIVISNTPQNSMESTQAGDDDIIDRVSKMVAAYKGKAI